HDRRLNGRGQPIRLSVRAVAPIAEGLDAAVLVAVEDFVAGLPRDPELGAQRRHFLALEQAGDKPQSLVHDVTLLPRPAPSWRGQSVTHPLGIRCYLSLRKDTGFLSIRFSIARKSAVRHRRSAKAGASLWGRRTHRLRVSFSPNGDLHKLR